MKFKKTDIMSYLFKREANDQVDHRHKNNIKHMNRYISSSPTAAKNIPKHFCDYI